MVGKAGGDPEVGRSAFHIGVALADGYLAKGRRFRPPHLLASSAHSPFIDNSEICQ